VIADLLDFENAHILVVDDEIVNIEIVEEVLRDNGFNNISSRTNSEQALAIYKEDVPDIILLDINMPVMTGFDLMTRFNEINHSIKPPVLILSAQADKKARLKAFNLGARDFLGKPFDEEEVVHRVRNLLEMHLVYKENINHAESLEKIVSERTKELLQAQKEIIACLGMASEFRDTDTAAHTIRVGHYAQILGKGIGLNDMAAEQLFLAAPMHDVGKIGIPDKVMLKPGKLDKEEWEQMKQHAVFGYDMMKHSKSRLLKNASIIALTHHEKWDGSGYPDGLKGTDIHLYGRLTALSDVFDALMMKRPYKEAWPLEKVTQLINDESGKHFDPEIVAAFNENLDKLLLIREKYSD